MGDGEQAIERPGSPSTRTTPSPMAWAGSHAPIGQREEGVAAGDRVGVRFRGRSAAAEARLNACRELYWTSSTASQSWPSGESGVAQSLT